MTHNYRIFGKNVSVRFFDEQSRSCRALQDQLALCPEATSSTDSPLTVNVGNDRIFDKTNVIMENPRGHRELKNGFIRDYGDFQTAIRHRNNKLEMDLSFRKPAGFVKRYSQKIRHDMEFSTAEERAGQICFENILVPSVYFDSNKCLVHSSGFVDSNGQGVLVGGTGGTGKTSLEIELCTHRGYTFLNDDVAVLSQDGTIFPNLAFPKIYGYNLENNPLLKGKIFRDRSMVDRLAWTYRYYLKGPQKVRRKISPALAFDGYARAETELNRYFILVRDATPKITVIDMDETTAARMTINVILAETWDFNNHLLWHEFNSAANRTEPLLALANVKKNWQHCLINALKGKNCRIIHVPFDIPHSKFVAEVSDIIAREN